MWGCYLEGAVLNNLLVLMLRGFFSGCLLSLTSPYGVWLTGKFLVTGQWQGPGAPGHVTDDLCSKLCNPSQCERTKPTVMAILDALVKFDGRSCSLCISCSSKFLPLQFLSLIFAQGLSQRCQCSSQKLLSHVQIPEHPPVETHLSVSLSCLKAILHLESKTHYQT